MDYCHECQILGQRQDFRFTTKITCHANLSIVPNPMLETVRREKAKTNATQRCSKMQKPRSSFRLHSREKAVTKCDKICYDFCFFSFSKFVSSVPTKIKTFVLSVWPKSKVGQWSSRERWDNKSSFRATKEGQNFVINIVL